MAAMELRREVKGIPQVFVHLPEPLLPAAVHGRLTMAIRSRSLRPGW
jgi:hypothetical protein